MKNLIIIIVSLFFVMNLQAQKFHAGLVNNNQLHKTAEEAKESDNAFWNAIKANDRSYLHSPESTINQLAFAWNLTQASDKYGKIDGTKTIDQTKSQLLEKRNLLLKKGGLGIKPADFKAGTHLLGCVTLKKNHEFDFCESRNPVAGNSQIGWEWGVYIPSTNEYWYSTGCGNAIILVDGGIGDIVSPKDNGITVKRSNSGGDVHLTVNFTNTNTNTNNNAPAMSTTPKILDPTEYLQRLDYGPGIARQQIVEHHHHHHHQQPQAQVRQRNNQWLLPVLSFVGAAAGALIPTLLNNRRMGGQPQVMACPQTGNIINQVSTVTPNTPYDYGNSAGGGSYDYPNTGGGSSFDYGNYGGQ